MGIYKKLLRGFALNIRNQIQSNKSFKSFNIFQNIKICSTNDYTIFSCERQMNNFLAYTNRISKGKTMLTWEAGKRSVH